MESKKTATSNAAGSPRVTPVANGSSEFAKFAGLAKKLANVPKKEVDELREQETNGKA
jgi:hypothetical protein